MDPGFLTPSFQVEVIIPIPENGGCTLDSRVVRRLCARSTNRHNRPDPARTTAAVKQLSNPRRLMDVKATALAPQRSCCV
ncbi:hypothetical protein BC830DRAFT_1156878 [Chytriomyces sp. MP71]|nr:hypothetical protein BC830DRAFT_1156878 [Chytriomyces sp. MP71]